MKTWSLCWFALFVAVGARADWQAFLREEPTRTKRDDQAFETLDRALKAEREASPEDRPYLFLYATLRMRSAWWSLRGTEAADALPDLTTPSQGWSRAQAKALFDTRLKTLAETADDYAKVPAEPFFAALRGGESAPWPNASALTVLAGLASSHPRHEALWAAAVAEAR